jgi:hypothetical protein
MALTESGQQPSVRPLRWRGGRTARRPPRRQTEWGKPQVADSWWHRRWFVIRVG